MAYVDGPHDVKEGKSSTDQARKVAPE